MKSIIEKGLGMNIAIMARLYLYPPDKLTFSFKVKAYSIFIATAPILSFLSVINFIIEKNLKDSQYSLNAFEMCEMACQAAKFMPFYVNGTRIKKCIHLFESSQFVTKNKRQVEILDEYCGICARNTKVFLGIVVIAVICFSTANLVTDETKKLPADLWFPFDPKSNLILYIGAYSFSVFATAYVAVAAAVVDPLISGLCCLATGQFAVLKDTLQNLHKYAEKVDRRKYGEMSIETVNRLVINKVIKKCVEHHEAILRFIDEYQTCFAMSIFCQLMGSSLVLCFLCLQMSKFDPLTLDFVRLAVYFIVMLLQIYLCSYYSTMLFEESNTVTDAIYMTNWFEFDIPNRKSLMILMERSKRPVVITVWKILEVSIETFTRIVRSAYSLLAVLKNM